MKYHNKFTILFTIFIYLYSSSIVIAVDELSSFITINAHVDTADSKEILDLSEGVKGVFFLNNNALISGGVDGCVKFWDIYSGKLVQSVFLESYSSLTRWSGFGKIAIDISSDKSMLAFLIKGRKIILWDIGNKKTVNSISSNGRYPTVVAFSSIGKIVAYDSFKNDYSLVFNRFLRGKSGVKLVRIADPKKVVKFLGFDSLVGSLNFSQNGEFLAVGLLDGFVYIWDCKRGEMLKVIKAHNDESTYFPTIRAVFSPDSLILATSGTDYTVKLWNTKTWDEIKTINLIPKDKPLDKSNVEKIVGFAFSPDSSLLAGGSAYSGKVYIWDMNSTELIYCFRGHKKGKEITSLNFSHDGNLLASGADDGIIKIWNVNSNDSKGESF